jgi:hypothetical protein
MPGRRVRLPAGRPVRVDVVEPVLRVVLETIFVLDQ